MAAAGCQLEPRWFGVRTSKRQCAKVSVGGEIRSGSIPPGRRCDPFGCGGACVAPALDGPCLHALPSIHQLHCKHTPACMHGPAALRAGPSLLPVRPLMHRVRAVGVVVAPGSRRPHARVPDSAAGHPLCVTGLRQREEGWFCSECCPRDVERCSRAASP